MLRHNFIRGNNEEVRYLDPLYRITVNLTVSNAEL